jgi:alginate O-acetyltransferase complex protein AlgI
VDSCERDPEVNFVSVQFLLFFAVVYGLYWSCSTNRSRTSLLTGASYLFYAAWDWRFCGLMLLVTLNAYAAGRALDRGSVRPFTVLAVSVGSSIAVLAIFKYLDFLALNATGLFQSLGLGFSVSLPGILLPVGISFYTFHAISYVVDVHRRKVPAATSFLTVALYIAFFPQLIAGPIVRASFFLPQLRRKRHFVPAQQMHGVQLFLRGLLYKAVIADTLALIADPVFADVDGSDPSSLATAAVAFYGQIYFDFAGYSCMAIGTARCFGYRLPRNFDYPYGATSVTEFWRRWHISLSSWLRDYLYVPLGGNRGSRTRTCRNLIVTFVVGGLWHGASWNFVLWGALHGIGLCVHKAWSSVRPTGPASVFRHHAWPAVALVLTQLWVLIGWVFFRAETLPDALTILSAIGSVPFHGLRDGTALLVLGVVMADHMFRTSAWRAPSSDRFAPAIVWLGLGAAAALLIMLMPIAQKGFIYFQF